MAHKVLSLSEEPLVEDAWGSDAGSSGHGREPSAALAPGPCPGTLQGEPQHPAFPLMPAPLSALGTP